MKVVILGGTGFMGYNLTSRLLADKNITPTVYSSSASSLVNLTRHQVDIKLVPYSQLAETELPEDTDFVINFAHPFTVRDNLSPADQIDNLCLFLNKNLALNPKLRLVHISSMSVYEPFDSSVPYDELSPLDPPPASDSYAVGKYNVDKKLLKHPELAGRMLILRPTIVFGPYCRPWADNILNAFQQGDVAYQDLNGHVQPIFVDDISRFIHEQLYAFTSGIFNMAGPETITWKDYLLFYAKIVAKGSLTKIPQESEPGAQPKAGKFTETTHNLRELVRIVYKEPAFISLIRPFVSRIPLGIRLRLRKYFGVSPKITATVISDKVQTGPFCRLFFAEDRLVSPDLFRQTFPEATLTPLNQTADTLKRYYEFRFTDKIYS
jgi:nucleoside-diphosphate-sugar epimerase